MMYGFSAVQKDPAEKPGLLFFIQRGENAEFGGRQRFLSADSSSGIFLLPRIDLQFTMR